MKVFIEEQRFTQTWLLIILCIGILVPVGILVQEILKPNGNMTSIRFILTLLFMLLCILPVFLIKLKTRIDEKGIYYQFFPFHIKTQFITWQNINKAYVRQYNPISEYGGWGIRAGFLRNKKNGKAVNISGDIGLQLILKNGKRLLIGTQKKEEINRILANYNIQK